MVKCQCLVQIEAHCGPPTSVPRCLYWLSQDSEATSFCLEGLMCCFLSFSVMSFVLKRVLSSFTVAVGEICLFRPRRILTRMPAVWRGCAFISVMDCDAYFTVLND